MCCRKLRREALHGCRIFMANESRGPIPRTVQADSWDSVQSWLRGTFPMRTRVEVRPASWRERWSHFCSDRQEFVQIHDGCNILVQASSRSLLRPGIPAYFLLCYCLTGVVYTFLDLVDRSNRSQVQGFPAPEGNWGNELIEDRIEWRKNNAVFSST